MNTKAVLTMVGVIGVPLAAHGASVTYDFTGRGNFCTFLSDGNTNCTEGITYTGTVRIDVLAPAPSGPGSFIAGTVAFDPFGWVESDFVIEWDSNSFSPAPTPGAPLDFSPGYDTFVKNNHLFGIDGLENREAHFSIAELSSTEARRYFSLAEMVRRTTNTSWLDDLSFDLTVGLAPVVVGGNPINNVNYISFNNYSFDHQTGLDWRGYIGQIQLTSLIPRIAVEIDIKPGSYPNSINPRNKGVIPVAVLGSGEFDATQVDSSTVHFGPGNASPVRDGRIANVNGDGYPDMLFHFRTQATGIQCGSNSASLSGKTFSGESFKGGDSIRTVGCKK
jgi:hypothetical protein